MKCGLALTCLLVALVGAGCARAPSADGATSTAAPAPAASPVLPTAFVVSTNEPFWQARVEEGTVVLDIVNDANDWAVETMQNPRYPLELFLRVITVSLKTMKIVNNLPSLDIVEAG